LPDSPPVRAILTEAFARRYDQGEALLEQQRFADAERQFRAALIIREESAEAHNNLGVALASTGRIDEAAVHFNRAVALDPGFSQARANLSKATGR